jgi:hypothetical protein
LPIGGINVSVADNINIDFIVRNDKSGDFSPLFEKAIKEAYKKKHIAEIGSTKFILVTKEYLIAMKIATMERKDEEDAERLLQLSNPDIDKLRRIIFDFLRPLGPARLENILRQAGHPKALPKGNYDKKSN